MTSWLRPGLKPETFWSQQQRHSLLNHTHPPVHVLVMVCAVLCGPESITWSSHHTMMYSNTSRKDGFHCASVVGEGRWEHVVHVWTTKTVGVCCDCVKLKDLPLHSRNHAVAYSSGIYVHEWLVLCYITCLWFAVWSRWLKSMTTNGSVSPLESLDASSTQWQTRR